MWDTVVGADALGLEWLTMFAFSTENWNRPKAEVRYLMGFNRGLLRRRRNELHRMNVRVRWLGRRDWRVPRSVLREMEISEELTKDNTGMTLTIAFNYGGRAEIVDAARAFAGTTEEEFRALLYAPEMHDPDLIIRTSGEQRLSNYLLWQCAYSEFVFRDELWPDFTREAFEASLDEYAARRRPEGFSAVYASAVRGQMSCSRTSSVTPVAIGVGKKPGAIAFTRMPALPSSTASALVSDTIPPLAA